MSTKLAWLGVIGAILLSSAANAGGLPRLRPFKLDVKSPGGCETLVAIDITNLTVNYRFDVINDAITRVGEKKSVSAGAVMEFTPRADGCPYFDLAPRPIRATLDGGKTVTKILIFSPSATTYKGTKTKTKLVWADKPLSAGTSYKLEITFALTNPDDVSITRGNAGFLLSLNDLLPRRFMEQFMPANLEFDQYPITFNFRLTGGNGADLVKAHKLFTSAESTTVSNDATSATYTVKFDAKTNTACPFLHLSGSKMVVHDFNVDGLPVTLYYKEKVKVGKMAVLGDQYTNDDVTQMKAVITEALKDHKAKLGATIHKNFAIYLNRAPLTLLNVDDPPQGMEHCGGTYSQWKTKQDAYWDFEKTNGRVPSDKEKKDLEKQQDLSNKLVVWHELHHSWIARGVMPGAGNWGWFDEAATSWNHEEYMSRLGFDPERSKLPENKAITLDTKDYMTRYSNSQQYTYGPPILIAAFGGKAAAIQDFLKTFYIKYKSLLYGTDDVQALLEKETGNAKLVQSLMDQYVFGILPPKDEQMAAGVSTDPMGALLSSVSALDLTAGMQTGGEATVLAPGGQVCQLVRSVIAGIPDEDCTTYAFNPHGQDLSWMAESDSGYSGGSLAPYPPDEQQIEVIYAGDVIDPEFMMEPPSFPFFSPDIR